MDKTELNKIVKTVSTKYYVGVLDDYVQTHAVYGIPCVAVNGDPNYYINELKKVLKQHKANRFRVVKNTYGFAILCFSNKKM